MTFSCSEKWNFTRGILQRVHETKIKCFHLPWYKRIPTKQNYRRCNKCFKVYSEEIRNCFKTFINCSCSEIVANGFTTKSLVAYQQLFETFLKCLLKRFWKCFETFWNNFETFVLYVVVKLKLFFEMS